MYVCTCPCPLCTVYTYIDMYVVVLRSPSSLSTTGAAVHVYVQCTPVYHLYMYFHVPCHVQCTLQVSVVNKP